MYWASTHNANSPRTASLSTRRWRCCWQHSCIFHTAWAAWAWSLRVDRTLRVSGPGGSIPKSHPCSGSVWPALGKTRSSTWPGKDGEAHHIHLPKRGSWRPGSPAGVPGGVRGLLWVSKPSLLYLGPTNEGRRQRCPTSRVNSAFGIHWGCPTASLACPEAGGACRGRPGLHPQEGSSRGLSHPEPTLGRALAAEARCGRV